MSNLVPVYNSKMDCPACEKNFEFGKVRSKTVRFVGQDTDMFPKYEGENPLFYDAIVCPYCGFAYIGTEFGLLNRNDYQAIRTKVTPKWARRNFEGPRTVDQAIEAYKIVLLNSTARQAPASEFAKDCMRLAWMHRIKGDSVIEMKYLERAFQFYQDAYMKEHLPVGKLDEFTVMYMVGELGRRIGKYKDSLSWFTKLITAGMNPANKARIPGNLLEMTRDQTLVTKDEMKAAGVGLEDEAESSAGSK